MNHTESQQDPTSFDQMPTTIVRFECGCIGTSPDVQGRSFILVACDEDGHGPGSPSRDMTGKAYSDIDFRAEVYNAFVVAEVMRRLRDAFRHVLH